MKIGDTFEGIVQDLAVGGKGVVKVDGLVIFVDGGLPGQKIRGKIIKEKRRHMEGKLIEVLEKSDQEIETPYQEVPGAPWANLPLEIQQKYKQDQVFSLFKKFVQFDLNSIFDRFVSSPETWGYRNKMEYSFGFSSSAKLEDGQSSSELRAENSFALGSKKRGQFAIVEPLKKPSGLFDEDFEKLLPEFSAWCEQTEIPPFDQTERTGGWRTLMVRKSFSENRFLVNLVVSQEFFDQLNKKSDQIVDFFRGKLGDRIAGIAITATNPAREIENTGRDLVYGTETITEKIAGLDFQLSIDSFFQPNPKAAEKLYEVAAEYAEVESGEQIYDLFCGTGTITQILASRFPDIKVTGVEIVESAVRDARVNAEHNKIENAKFQCADVRKFLKTALWKDKGNISTVIVDPPRAGIVPKSLKRIIEFFPRKLVYVSCNPATLARDTAVLIKAGYTLEKLSLVDQFPHTSHIESVARFVRSAEDELEDKVSEKKD